MATGQKAIKATTRTRQVAEENIPAELLGMYSDDRPKADAEAVSLDFTSEPSPDEEPEAREKLFGVDGVDYTIPVEFGPGVALVYLNRLSEGQDIALGAVLKAVMGPKGWAALMKLAENNRISMAQMQEIMRKVQSRTMGAIEDTGKN